MSERMNPIRKKWPVALLGFLALFLFFCNFVEAKDAGQDGSIISNAISVVHVADIISPPIADHVKAAIRDAAAENSHALIIVLDTPGGLDLAMRDIVKDILNAPLPIIVFVAPSGARAASAGAIITVSAHIAAMAPGTNIGAAHPVSLGFGGGGDKVMEKKIQNDMIAYAQSIADIRGKNRKWIEQAVRSSSSLTANEAKRAKVIDVVAADIPDLLAKIDGMKVTVGATQKTLSTRNAKIAEKGIGLRHKILAAISNPNIAYILFLIGLAGLYFEFSVPGVIFPGVMGAIALLLAFFSMQTLPVSFAGVALILLAIVLFIMEVKIISHGILTIGGIVALLLGSLMLFESPDPALMVSPVVFIPSLTLIVLFFVVVIRLAIKAQSRKKMTGTEGLIGKTGVYLGSAVGRKTVLVDGEYWQATTKDDIVDHAEVVIEAVEGLVLTVRQK